MSIKRELYRAHCFKWQTIINKVVQTCTVSDNLHFLLSRYLKQPQIQLFFTRFCSRVLHWLAAAGGHGGAGRVPLRPLHPRPQRQRQGGVQPRGQEVGQIYIYSIFTSCRNTHSFYWQVLNPNIQISRLSMALCRAVLKPQPTAMFLFLFWCQLSLFCDEQMRYNFCFYWIFIPDHVTIPLRPRPK